MEKAYLEQHIALIDEMLTDESVPSHERNFARERRKELSAMLEIVIENERKKEEEENLLRRQKEEQKKMEMISTSRSTMKKNNGMRNKIITRDINYYNRFST